MAKPRIFVSSTFYDLKHARAALEAFIRGLGYDPILHERGGIAYGAAQKPEHYAYKEIEQCDILVSIVGGKFGSQASGSEDSISQKEVRRALDLGKQVYILIDAKVQAEFETFQLNAHNDQITYKHGDVRVYRFLQELETLPRNNATETFNDVEDICEYLREQWAGSFQRFLRDATNIEERRIIDDLMATSKSLKEMVFLLQEGNESARTELQNLLTVNHPLFEDIRRKLRLGHRVFFQSRDELDRLLVAHGYDYDVFSDEGRSEYRCIKGAETRQFSFSDSLFDDSGALVLSDASVGLVESFVRSTSATSADEYDPFSDE